MALITEQDVKLNLRLTLVQMLFALTIGEIARQAAILATDEHPSQTYLAAYAHLCLATILVATSWVGWARSSAPGNLHPVERVFSLPFLVLLIDVVLVICYFIIARGAEMPKVDAVTNAPLAVVPSARNESVWITIVFAGYLLWDFLTKAVMQKPLQAAESQPAKGDHAPAPAAPGPCFCVRLRNEFLKRAWMSFLCFCLAGASWIWFWKTTGIAGVLAVDAALLAVILLFRSLKQYVDPTEFWAGSWPDRLRRLSLPVFSLILYVASLVAASY